MADHAPVIASLMEKGWTQAQAAGIAANFHAESSFNPSAVGDGGKAYGIGQWHPDRQAEFKAKFGKPIQGSTLEEQLQFADYELRAGKEQSAGKRLLAATTAGDAGEIVSRYYERPAAADKDAGHRRGVAAQFAGEAPGAPQGGSSTLPLPAAARTPQKAVARSGDMAALSDLQTEIRRNAALDDTIEASRAQSQVSQQVDVAYEAKRSATGISEVFNTALGDPRTMPSWTVLDRLNQDREVPPPGWSYLDQKDKLEAGMNDDERSYMRENVRGPESLIRAQAQISMRRDNDQTYGLASGFSGFVGQMGAGFTDPGSLLLGAGISKAFGVLKIGHAALAARGQGVAAAGSLLAENALANVAIEGVSDAMGEVKTSHDYVMAAAAGAVLSAPFTRGVFKEAADAEVRNLARGMQDGAVAHQHAKVEETLRREPTLSPTEAARKVEAAEFRDISEAVEAHTAKAPIRDSVIPDDVNEGIRAEYEGEPHPVAEKMAGPFDKSSDSLEFPKIEAIDAQADIKPETRQMPFARDPIEVGTQVRKAVEGRGEVLRSIPAKDGSTVELHWDLRENTLKTNSTVRDTLDAMLDLKVGSPQTQRTARYLRDVLSQDVRDVNMRFSKGAKNGYFDPNTKAISIPSPMAADMPIKAHLQLMSDWHTETVLHEITHAATHSKLRAWEAAPDKVAPGLRKAAEQLKDLHERYKAALGATPRSTDTNVRHQLDYATKDLHEFASQLMASKDVREFLNRMPGKDVAGMASNAWREFISILKRILGGGKSAFDEGSKLLDTIIQADGSNIVYANGHPALYGPAQRAGTTAKDFAARIYEHAEQYLAKNPIDLKRTEVITNKIGGTSDGLVLARSKNPIMQMVASLVTETTTGAAGRKATVAIRQKMMHSKLLGDGVLEFNNSYNVWRSANGGGAVEDIVKGAKKREFNNLVFEETLKRRSGDYKPNGDQAVMEAADSLERLFTRAAVAQKDAGTLGSANLPSSSRGYMPQALDGVKLQTLSVADSALLHAELSLQFQNNLGWDAKFADTFAPYYTDRVRKRAQGDKGIDGLAAGGDSAQVVRDTLDEMAFDPSLRDRAAAAQKAKAGLGQTKKRLDIDLMKELRPGLRIMDVYTTDPLMLARTYAKRTAGTVALTESGIHGIRGIRELRSAAATPVGDGNRVTAEELGAFDRVMAETLGTPTAGDVVSAGASNMQMLVTLQRLGSLPFTQTAEMFNMIHHLGFRSLVSGVGELPKMFGEVGRLKRGQASGNHILTSIEQYGGEIGTSDYKMVAALDAPDERLGEYLDQPGVLSRLLRAGGHAQTKISGFRGLLAAQHRMVAEQVVMKAARYIRDGGESKALADMGFTPEMATAMKGELDKIAKWDGADRLQSFDLSQVSDPRVAEAFVQSVHRGVSQVIQGTFIGEKNKWFHNDYLKLLLQLRSFGITSAEKQWGRTRMNHGYASAAGLMLGQMALALPIHLARLQVAAAGREDRDKFLKDNMNPASLIKAVMNYSSMSGFTGDVLEITAGLAGGWADQETRAMLGTKQQSMSVGRMVPVAGTVDSAVKAISGKADLHTALKQLPFSNLWYLIPAINLAKHD